MEGKHLQLEMCGVTGELMTQRKVMRSSLFLAGIRQTEALIINILIAKLDSMLYSNDFSNDQIDDLYVNIVCTLTDAEKLFVPRHSKNFYKFWWMEEAQYT